MSDDIRDAFLASNRDYNNGEATLAVEVSAGKGEVVFSHHRLYETQPDDVIKSTGLVRGEDGTMYHTVIVKDGPNTGHYGAYLAKEDEETP